VPWARRTLRGALGAVSRPRCRARGRMRRSAIGHVDRVVAEHPRHEAWASTSTTGGRVARATISVLPFLRRWVSLGLGARVEVEACGA